MGFPGTGARTLPFNVGAAIYLFQVLFVSILGLLMSFGTNLIMLRFYWSWCILLAHGCWCLGFRWAGRIGC